MGTAIAASLSLRSDGNHKNARFGQSRYIENIVFPGKIEVPNDGLTH